MRRIDDGEDSIVYFTDEAGSWQLRVCWPKVLPAYFSSLANTLTKQEYERRVDALLEGFGAQARPLARRLWSQWLEERVPAFRSAIYGCQS
jgi:hypothetical protein